MGGLLTMGGRVVLAALMLCAHMFASIHAAGGMNIQGRIFVPETMTPPTLEISLNNGERSALSRLDGSFILEGVPDGLYSLQVVSVDWIFPSYQVTVAGGQVLTSYHNEKRQKRELQLPLRLEPIGKPMYFEPRQQMSVSSMFMNPMGMMMGFMLLTVVILPKMMGAMDPEEMKKMQEDMKKNQADQPDPQKLLGSFFGGAAAEADSDSD